MTRLTTTLTYTVFFIASVHFLQCSAKETEMQGDGNRRNMLGYMPDLAEYFTSYNRLMNQGNLNDRRPLAVRRDMNNKTDKRVLGDIMKPIMDVMGPFGGVFNGFKNETRRQAIKKTTTQDGNLNKSAKQKQRCHAACPRSDSPICVTNFKNTAEFPNVCEYRKQTRCFKQLDGWKIQNHGRCPKISNRRHCIVRKAGDDKYFMDCP